MYRIHQNWYLSLPKMEKVNHPHIQIYYNDIASVHVTSLPPSWMDFDKSFMPSKHGGNPFSRNSLGNGCSASITLIHTCKAINFRSFNLHLMTYTRINSNSIWFNFTSGTIILYFKGKKLQQNYNVLTYFKTRIKYEQRQTRTIK